MARIYCVSFLFFCILSMSCKIQSNSDQIYSGSDREVYRLRLQPSDGSKYHYDITNITEMNIEAEGKEINNRNKSHVGVNYDISKDSLGDFMFTATYDKIQIHSKNGEQETTLDASNAAATVNPSEKMLGILKDATVVAVVSPNGEQKEIRGFDSMVAKLLESFDPNDVHAKEAAKAQWEKMVTKGLVKNNMDQLFQLFPDSAVRVGDKWKLTTKQEGEVNLSVTTTYKLEQIEDGVAVIESESDIENDQGAATSSSFQPTASLKGRQEGHYEMDVNTGMLKHSKITATLKGTIQTMGKEIPITAKTNVVLDGRKVK